MTKSPAFLSLFNFCLRNTKWFAISGVVFIALSFAVINHPPLLGFWESTVVYRSFQPRTRPALVLAIQKSANTTGHHGKYGYTLLEGSRWLADILGHRISIIKALPVIYGLLSLFLWYIILNRWYGWKVAVVATGLLATNPTFLTFQHSLIAQTMTIAALLFCLERFQNLSTKNTVFAAISLGFACAIASTSMVFARITMIIILSLCLIDCNKILTEFRQMKLSLLSSQQRVKNFLIAFASMLIWLTLFYPKNILQLFSKEFIVGNVGERTLILESNGFANLFHNIKFLINYFILDNQQLSFSSNLIISRPFPLEDKITFILVGVGVLISLRSIRNYSNFILLFLFSLFLAAALQSSAMLDAPFEVSSTLLAGTRTYYLVPFLSAFAAIGFQFIYKILQNKNIKLCHIFVVLITLLILVRGGLHVQEIKRFREYITSYEFDFTQTAPVKFWRKEAIKHDLLQKEKIELNLNQVYFHNLAQFIFNQIRKKEHQTFEGTKLIYVPWEYYTPDYIRYGGGSTPWKGYPYYFPMFLTFYLQELGLNISYLVKEEDILNNYFTRFLNKIEHLEQENRSGANLLQNFTRENLLIQVQKSLKIIESWGWTKKWLDAVRQQKHYNSQAEMVGEYFINVTSYKNPEYILITDKAELQTYDGVANKKLLLTLPDDLKQSQ